MACEYSLDVTDLSKGHFDEALLRYVAPAPSFPSLSSRLMPSIPASRSKKTGCTVRSAHAILTGRNIVPVMFPEFEFPAQLPDDIRDLPRHQGVKYSHDFFEAVIDKILRLIGAQTVEKRPAPLSGRIELWTLPCLSVYPSAELRNLLP